MQGDNCIHVDTHTQIIVLGCMVITSVLTLLLLAVAEACVGLSGSLSSSMSIVSASYTHMDTHTDMPAMIMGE